MEAQKSIISEMYKNVSFTETELAIIQPVLKKKFFKKGEILISPDKTVYHKYYVYSGCLRAYHIDKNLKEHTVLFAIKDWWITDLNAYYNTTKSNLIIEVIEDAIVYEIPKKEIEILYSKIHKLETFYRKKIEKGFASYQNRILENSLKSAEEKYISFIKNYPEIEKKVKNYHIASYLGITSESLSRIRKNLK